MSNRDLPKASFNVRGDLRSVITPKALERWRPEVQAKDGAGDDAASISILDVIGQDWSGNGVTASRISAALRNIGKQFTWRRLFRGPRDLQHAARSSGEGQRQDPRRRGFGGLGHCDGRR